MWLDVNKQEGKCKSEGQEGVRYTAIDMTGRTLTLNEKGSSRTKENLTLLLF